MTAAHQKKHWYASITPKQFCLGFLSVFCFLLLLRNSDFAVRQIRRGLTLCADSVIPSLFPFMVLSEWIVAGGFGNLLLRPFALPFRKLFGLSTSGCCAFLLGVLCGFPVGAKCAVAFYDRGEITKSECERVLCFANNPSPAFLIGTVGTTLWCNRGFGIVLYLTVLLAACLTALLTRRHQQENSTAEKTRLLPSHQPQLCGARLLTHSVRTATENMLLVCAYVIFFSAFTGTLNLILSSRLSESAQAVTASVFELSGGMSLISKLNNKTVSVPLCAFAAGWSGLSVHCQVLSVCDGRELSFRPYFLAKLFQAFLCAWLLIGIQLVFPNRLPAFTVG